MSPLKKLTKSFEKQITNDWHQELPSLGIYRPRRLLRRVGPLLVGIVLERDSGGDVYKPMFHVHCLGKPSETVSLMLFSQLRSDRSGGPDFVDLRWHEDKYMEAVKRMVRQSPLPLEGDLTIEQVLNAYRAYLETPLGKRMAAHLYTDMILLLVWAGRTSDATAIKDEALRTIVEENRGYQHVGGREQFEPNMQKAIEDPESVRRVVDEQIEALSVSDLPVARLIA